MEARDEAASACREAVRVLQTAAAGWREVARECGWWRWSPHAQAVEAFFGSLLERKVRDEEVASNLRFSGVLLGEHGEAAASGMRRQNLVPGSLRGGLKRLDLRSQNGQVNTTNQEPATSR